MEGVVRKTLTWYSLRASLDILHIKKAVVRALRSHVRTVQMGDMPVDWSGFLAALGPHLSMSAFKGFDWMSDAEAHRSLLFNVSFVVWFRSWVAPSQAVLPRV